MAGKVQELRAPQDAARRGSQFSLGWLMLFIGILSAGSALMAAGLWTVAVSLSAIAVAVGAVRRHTRLAIYSSLFGYVFTAPALVEANGGRHTLNHLELAVVIAFAVTCLCAGTRLALVRRWFAAIVCCWIGAGYGFYFWQLSMQ